MARGYFHAVQFVRHPAVPLYTPEPDVIHDIFGHGIHLTSPAIADIYRLSGQAAARVNSPEALEVISHVYWFTLECGLVAEHGVPKAFGAALLSSYGEIGRSVRQIRELDVSDVMRTGYEISEYQPVLFCAHSLGHMTDTLGGFLETLDDDAVPRPCREAGQASSGNSAGPGWRSRRFTYPPPIKETLPSA
ncbi:hypothetical protein ACRB68_16920 [Actinomadura sp. RB68]|uniref:Biopterin-dependent aromatic amino acid hydroxylase family profile domain-containing protein n=2 Tax=Actinomadura macrotermitis TaxID=2585200 RepID=A0A7K0BR99_9ACTN|nr:hypothetical protein [Actinomadura macrotermitis]